MPEPVLIPDLAEALVGRRCWGLANTEQGIRLAARGDVIWPADQPLHAVCDLGKKHDSPADKCTCGIYALSTEEEYPYYGYDGRTRAVFGETYLWGAVIRGSRGFRAQCAFPNSSTSPTKTGASPSHSKTPTASLSASPTPTTHRRTNQWTSAKKSNASPSNP